MSEETAEFPTVLEGTAFVTHIKPAEDLDGIIVRVTENIGKDGEIVMSVPDWVKKVYITDMPEKKRKEATFDKTLRLDIRGFEIATLRFCK
jgi:alpha-mannosidase